MPRNKRVFRNDVAYHITARSNNKEWFYIEQKDCWNIFTKSINHICKKYSFQLHAFVLMNNHYHLIGSTSSEIDLGQIMQWFQTHISKEINSRTNRMNHVFGGRYKCCMIDSKYYFAHALKYVYQNPLRAKLAKNVFDYEFSTANELTVRKSNLFISSPPVFLNEILIKMDNATRNSWFNKLYQIEDKQKISRSLRKSKFEIKNRKHPRKPHWTSYKI